jgi:catechol 2,3-dioxygenase
MPMTTTDLTRRILLCLAGASSACGCRDWRGACGRLRDKRGPTYANGARMRIGMVTLRVRNLDTLADRARVVRMTAGSASDSKTG